MCRFEDQRFKAFDAEHVVEAVEDLDQSVGVENQTVPLGQFNFVYLLRRRNLGKTTEYPVP